MAALAQEAAAIDPPVTLERPRASSDDAWWTGPMLANSAATLPKGHALVETYAFHQIQKDSSLYGSLTYLLYGITDKFTIGLKPMFGMTSSGGDTSRVGFGDLTLHTQYRLTSLDAAPDQPAISVSLQHALPTGRYDQLDTRPAPGLGSGSHATIVALYGQQYFWLANGRPFRTRLNISSTFSREAKIKGGSIYGTHSGFRGRAKPGDLLSLGVSGEYSVNRSWVLALDLIFNHAGTTRVKGFDPPVAVGGLPVPVQYSLGSSQWVSIAPAVEYSWTPNLGVLFGTRFNPRGRNNPASITPAVAINYVY